MFPLGMMPNTSSMTGSVSVTSANPTTMNGISLPATSSLARSGVTMSCSIVPCSRSFTRAMLVTTIVVTSRRTPITPGTM